MLNIVIPAAGRGRRFLEKGWIVPKPFIHIGSQPMIQHVIDNVRPGRDHRFVLLVQADALRFLSNAFAGMTIVAVPEPTEGAACTVLLASHIIDSSDPLLIVNSDQLISWDVDRFLDHAGEFHGSIATFTSSAPQYSYVALNRGFVTEVAEKRVISDQATAGAYFWRSGSDFCDSARQMVAEDRRVGGEFYVAPVFAEAISRGALVTTYHVPHVDALGTPEDLESYLEATGLRPPASV